jgi:ribonuclease-3
VGEARGRWRRLTSRRERRRPDGPGDTNPGESSAAERELEAALGHVFRDRRLLRRALTHSSATFEEEASESNERLEFLGDAVLDLMVSSVLYRELSLSEGEMSKVRAAVVSEMPLAKVARDIAVGPALHLGRGEEASGGREKVPILADAMEALIGAVFLDGGFEAAREVVYRFWDGLIHERAATPGERDYKTRLQERVAKQGLAPEYTSEGSGPDHARTFTATVRVGGQELGTGLGSSKKRAEQAAAQAALGALGDLDA